MCVCVFVGVVWGFNNGFFNVCKCVSWGVLWFLNLLVVLSTFFVYVYICLCMCVFVLSLFFCLKTCLA